MPCVCLVSKKQLFLPRSKLKGIQPQAREIVMRFILKINWALLTSILTVSSIYLMFLENLYLTEINSSGGVKSLENFDKELSEEREFLKKRFPNLWRPSGSNNLSTDRVKLFEDWIETLADSEYLKRAKTKRILVFGGFHQYYGTEGKLRCPFLLEQREKLLQSKCSLDENIALKPIIEPWGYSAYVTVRNWRPVIFEQKIPSVKQVLYIEESPFVAKYADLSVNNAILTSYWSGSDIVLPYGYFRKQSTQFTKKPQRNYAKGKTQLAAIIVSNCNALNGRLRYVQELQKHIPVSVFGKCGPLKCDKGCYSRIQKDYKFYLAFEKANCRDYITEKFWRNALKNDMVPVVMGAPKEDYERLGPPRSFIHVEDFENPKQLATFLKTLDKNDSMYNEYFKYKLEGEVTTVWEQFFCRLCGLLHYSDATGIEGPKEWEIGKESWDKVNTCLPPMKWYWDRE